jgi:hypothetical protein
MSETRIVSFVVRFVQQEDEHNRPVWRGLIRHVQSREERHFQMLPDALQFIGRYVDLAGMGLPENPLSPPLTPSKSERDADD